MLSTVRLSAADVTSATSFSAVSAIVKFATEMKQLLLLEQRELSNLIALRSSNDSNTSTTGSSDVVMR